MPANQRTSNCSNQSKRNLAPFEICTVGYEGKTVDAVLEELLQNNISRLIDVRRNPISRKPGFSKKALCSAAESLGIEYIHVPELGISSDSRRNLKTKADYQKLLRSYDSQLLPQADLFLRQTAQLTTERPSALMCFERDVECCHRNSLAKAISEITGFTVRHIP